MIKGNILIQTDTLYIVYDVISIAIRYFIKFKVLFYTDINKYSHLYDKINCPLNFLFLQLLCLILTIMYSVLYIK